MPEMTAFDWTVLVVVTLSTLFSFARGAVREAITIGIWVGALTVAYHGFSPIQQIAKRTIETAWLADVATLVVVLIVPLIVFKVIGSVLVEQFAGRRLAGTADRAVGVVFGLVRGAVIVCVFYLIAAPSLEPDQRPAWLREAAFLPYVEDGARVIRRLLPDALAEDGDVDLDVRLRARVPAPEGREGG